MASKGKAMLELKGKVEKVLGEVIKRYDIDAGVVTCKNEEGYFQVVSTLGLERILGEDKDLNCLHSSSFCKLLVHRKMPVIIENVPGLSQWKDDPLIKASCGKLIFYGEVALLSSEGRFCGSLSLLHGEKKKMDMPECDYLMQQASKLAELMMEVQMQEDSVNDSEYSTSCK